MPDRSGGPADTTKPPRIAYTPREAAASIGISYRAVLRLIADGKIAHRAVSERQYVIPVGAIEAWLTGKPAA